MATDDKDHKGKQVSVSSSSLEIRKRKPKAEKDVTLEILRQHFAGSLKDAAKNIGVCPTTLKKICRQHGISRWPSRKIKKVGHSLMKLQVVMDSVKGAQGSLYSGFPQLQQSSSSFPFLNPTKTVQESPPSSSGSQSSSGSSTCFSSEEQQLGGLHEEQRPIRVKAIFGDSKMRMRLQPQWRLRDLRREITKRFQMDDDMLTSNLSLKYLDDDKEWVLLTCDADFDECLQVYKSSLKETIRISVHHPTLSLSLN